MRDSTEKHWRYLDFFQHQAFLIARVPRVDCPEHGGAPRRRPLGSTGQRFHVAHGDGDAHLGQAEADRPDSRDGSRARHSSLASDRASRAKDPGHPRLLGGEERRL
ncbi:MAG: transposase family protein [Acidimicrobiales bacterium]